MTVFLLGVASGIQVQDRRFAGTLHMPGVVVIVSLHVARLPCMAHARGLHWQSLLGFAGQYETDEMPLE